MKVDLGSVNHKRGGEMIKRGKKKERERERERKREIERERESKL